MTTAADIDLWRALVTPELCADDATYRRFVTRIEDGSLTRDENAATHFCVYFWPVDVSAKKVFLVHHKKAQLWLAPGGHIDHGETPYQALNREISEELGVREFFNTPPKPFLFSIVDIDSDRQTCKAHHDAWFALLTDGSNFNIDPTEFMETRWVTADQARDLVTDASTLVALQKIEKMF